MDALHDMHCHLDFMSNGEKVARDAQAAGSQLFATTVTPAGYLAARTRFDTLENVHVGLGLHPWWVQEGDPARVVELLEGQRLIGEVGLDFAKRHEATRAAQIEAFTTIADACGAAGDKVLSIHSVRSAQTVLDVLEAGAALETCTCIFHWYSGPSDQLKRAIDAGCYFSVNVRMLDTGKGREYVKAIPARRLLLETDAPPGQNIQYSWESLQNELKDAASRVAAIKGPAAIETIAENTRNILK